MAIEETPSAKSEKGHASSPATTGTTEIVPEIVIDRGSPVSVVSAEKPEEKPAEVEEGEDDDEVQAIHDFSKFSKEELVEKMTQLSKNRDDMFQHLIGNKSAERETADVTKGIRSFLCVWLLVFAHI